MPINSKQRAKLKSYANGIDAIFQLGKSGITPDFTNSLANALRKRELVKITVLENSDEDVKDAASIIAEATESEVVQVIGRKIVLYKKNVKEPLYEI